MVICDGLRVDQWWTFEWLICRYLWLFFCVSILFYLLTHTVTISLSPRRNAQRPRNIGIVSVFPLKRETRVIKVARQLVCVLSKFMFHIVWKLGLILHWSVSNWRDFGEMIHLDFTICYNTLMTAPNNTRSEIFRERMFIFVVDRTKLVDDELFGGLSAC